jgi:hypothetical protein
MKEILDSFYFKNMKINDFIILYMRLKIDNKIYFLFFFKDLFFK